MKHQLKPNTYTDPQIHKAVEGKTVTLSDAINFPIWMQQNRWYNFSGGKWHYTFEEGTAISKETYEKKYTKTPTELFELYQVDVNKGWKP